MFSRRTTFGSAVPVALAVVGGVGCATHECLARGTRVATPQGPRPIESLRPGDLVFSWDTVGRTMTARRVVGTRMADRRSVLRITTADGLTVDATDEHPFWCDETRAWFPAGRLEPAQRLLAIHSAETRVVAIERIEREPTPVDVFDLAVEGPEHNFFANEILVHNKEDTGPGDTGPVVCVPNSSVDIGPNAFPGWDLCSPLTGTIAPGCWFSREVPAGCPFVVMATLDGVPADAACQTSGVFRCVCTADQLMCDHPFQLCCGSAIDAGRADASVDADAGIDAVASDTTDDRFDGSEGNGS